MRGITAAFICTLIALAAGYALRPAEITGTTDIAGRLAFALKADIFLFLWLAAAVARIAQARFVSADDIRGGGLTTPSPSLAIKSAFLQNTLEQVVLALGAHLALAVLLRGSEVVIIPVLILLFAIGRAAFWIGYPGGGAARSFGFALTFMPTVFGYVISLVLLIWRG